MKRKESTFQKTYYTSTAEQYDDMHIAQHDEHYFALNFMVSMLDILEVKSILDVGAGTGRAMIFIT